MKRVVAFVGAAALAAAVLSGCGAIVALTPQSDCTLTVESMHPSKGTAGQMGSKGRLVCDTAVSTMTITVTLQRYTNGNWVNVFTGTPAVHRNVPGFSKETGQAFVPCAGGTWRGSAKATVVYRGATVTLQPSPFYGPSGSNIC